MSIVIVKLIAFYVLNKHNNYLHRNIYLRTLLSKICHILLAATPVKSHRTGKLTAD